MMRAFPFHSILSLLALAPLASLSQAAVTSTFDVDADGWHTVTYTSPTGGSGTDYTNSPNDYGMSLFSPMGGNPGGYVYDTDPDTGDTFFSAPSKFLGNDLSAYGTNLTYDLADTGNAYNAAATVVLKGAGLVAVYTSPTLPSTAFTAFSIPLTETGWVSNAYGGAATSQANFKAIL